MKAFEDVAVEQMGGPIAKALLSPWEPSYKLRPDKEEMFIQVKTKPPAWNL